MPDDANKQKLINFLERRVWNPVLKATPSKYSDPDRKVLERVQRKTESQRERYQSYDSAGRLRQEFQDDLQSQQARKVNADLQKLKLPIQADVKDEFFGLADRLGIGPGRQARRTHKPHPPHPWHKSKPEEREKAARELTRQARKGDKAAIETLKKAPQKGAREYAKKLTKPGAKKATAAKKKAAPARKKR
jgi:hypothetical protein